LHRFMTNRINEWKMQLIKMHDTTSLAMLGHSLTASNTQDKSLVFYQKTAT